MCTWTWPHWSEMECHMPRCTVAKNTVGAKSTMGIMNINLTSTCYTQTPSPPPQMHTLTDWTILRKKMYWGGTPLPKLPMVTCLATTMLRLPYMCWSVHHTDVVAHRKGRPYGCSHSSHHQQGCPALQLLQQRNTHTVVRSHGPTSPSLISHKLLLRHCIYT